MKLLLLLLSALVGLVAVTSAQNAEVPPEKCQLGLAVYKGCVGKVKKVANPIREAEAQKQKREQKKVERSMCLTVNGCFKDPQNVGNGCVNDAMKRIRRRLEKCTRTDLSELLGLKKRKRGEAFGARSSQRLKNLEKICQTPEGAEKALACLIKHKKDSKRAAQKERRKDRRQSRKDKKAKSKCKKELGSECYKYVAAQKKDSANILCKCAQRLKADSTLAADLEACEAMQGEVADEDESAGGEVSPVDNLITKLCAEGRSGNIGKPKRGGKKGGGKKGGKKGGKAKGKGKKG